MAKQPKKQASRPEPSGDQSTALIHQQTLTASSGPLPPAYEMEYYESVMAGAADRIFAMAEREQAHRHQQEQEQRETNLRVQEANIRTADANIRTQDASINEIKRGQWMAFTLATAYLAATVYLGIEGREIVASAMTLGGIAALAAVFIKVRNKQ